MSRPLNSFVPWLLSNSRWARDQPARCCECFSISPIQECLPLPSTSLPPALLPSSGRSLTSHPAPGCHSLKQMHSTAPSCRESLQHPAGGMPRRFQCAGDAVVEGLWTFWTPLNLAFDFGNAADAVQLGFDLAVGGIDLLLSPALPASPRLAGLDAASSSTRRCPALACVGAQPASRLAGMGSAVVRNGELVLILTVTFS